MRPHACAGEREHRITHLPLRNVRTDRFDHTGEFGTEYSLLRVSPKDKRRYQAEAFGDLFAAHAPVTGRNRRGVDTYQNLAPVGFRPRHLAQPDDFGATVFFVKSRSHVADTRLALEVNTTHLITAAVGPPGRAERIR